MSRAGKIVLAIAVVIVTSPVWGFEIAYHALLPWEKPVLPAVTRATPLELEALWVAAGESGEGATQFWALRDFHSHARGGDAARQAGNAWVFQDETREKRYRNDLRRAAIQIWMGRNATPDELKRALAEWSSFGRGAVGIEDAAKAYFGCSTSTPSTAQVALLAALYRDAHGNNPLKHPDSAAASRHWVLEKLASAGKISAEEFAKADAEKIEVLPKVPKCD